MLLVLHTTHFHDVLLKIFCGKPQPVKAYPVFRAVIKKKFPAKMRSNQKKQAKKKKVSQIAVRRKHSPQPALLLAPSS